MPQGCDDSATGTAGRALRVSTGLLVFLLTAAVASAAWSRQGNLAWDDADYLRQALRVVDRAGDRGPIGLVPALLSGTLKEKPKPPLLVAWIEAGRVALGRRTDLRPLIVFATAVPFGLLAVAVGATASKLAGPRAGVAAVLALGASPMTLAFGAKVMVETFMALWVLLALFAATALLARPARPRAAAFGAALGLGMMTKLTVALLLPLPLIAFVVLYARRHGLGRRSLPVAASVLVPVLLIAGPWYARNGAEAVRFAVWSSRYNEVAEGRSDVVPLADRLSAMASQLSGWPAFGAEVLAATALLVLLWKDKRGRDSADPRLDFLTLTTLGAVGGGAVLLRTTYFDPRFLLPIWASLAVAVGVALAMVPLRAVAMSAGLLLLLGLGTSARDFLSESTTRTYWGARPLIDELVERHGVSTIGNLGNCAEWNVCKTGLINEMRRSPRDCFVLLDVSQWAPQDVERRLEKVDALLVLDDATLSPETRAAAPGLNRAFDQVRQRLQSDTAFERVAVESSADLPPLSVFVRRR